MDDAKLLKQVRVIEARCAALPDGTHFAQVGATGCTCTDTLGCSGRPAWSAPPQRSSSASCGVSSPMIADRLMTHFERVTEALLAELRPGDTREVSLAMVDGYGSAEREP